MFARMLRPIAAALMWLAIPAGAAPPAANVQLDGDAEIVIEGRRTADRYRIPANLRPIAAADSRTAPAASDPRLACRDVGAYGCGTELLPIVTVRGDGSVQVGATPEGQQ